MMRSSAAIFALLLPTGAVAQDKKDADKIGKDKAQAVLKKVLAENLKKKSAAISESAEMATGPRKLTGTFDGVLRKDFAAVKGSAELYAKGAVTLVNVGGRFDPPEELQGQDGAGAQGFKNPSLLIEERSEGGR